MTVNEILKLESLIDKYSLHEVLDALQDICDMKADHILSNWQDKDLADYWQQQSKKIGRLV